jgi:hypothetical protein
VSGKTRNTIGQVLTFVGAVVSYAGYPYIGLLIMAAGQGLSYDAAKRLKREAEIRARAGNRSEGVRGNIRGTHDHHLLVFGRTRVGGKVLDQETSAGADWDNQNYHISIAHSLCHAGGCGGILDFWIDDTRIDSSAISGDIYTGLRDVNIPTYGTGIVQLRHWKGTAAQGNDSDFPGAGGAATAYCRGMARTHFKLNRPNDDEKFRNVYKYGPPVLTVEFLGILCYDPRLDTTMGGSGSHRANDPTTWAASENPALCTATYLIMNESDGGCGESVLVTDSAWWASVASAANICDETISTPAGTKTRYTGMGVVLSTADHRKVNIQKLLDCMGPNARLVPVNGGASYRLYAGAYRTPTFSIDEAWLAGGYTLYTRNQLEAQYNAVRVNYDDFALDYKTIEAPPYTSGTYETEDGGVRTWENLTLAGVTDPHRAQYIAQQMHKRSRYQAMIELTVNLKGMDLELWETGTLELPGVDLAGRVWRLAYYHDQGTEIQLVLEEEHSSIYTVDTFLTANTSGTSGAAFSTPAVPALPSCAAVENGTLITWTPPRFSTVVEVVEIHRADSSGGSFAKIAEVPLGVDRFVDRLETGAAKYYKLRSRSRLYTYSAFTAELNPTTTPSAPTSPAAEPVENGIRLSWTKPASDLTYEVTEIHRATSSGGTFNKVGEVASGGDTYIDRRTDNLFYYYKLRARNRLGIVSAFTSEVNAAAGLLTRAGSATRLGDQRNGVAVWAVNRTPAIANSSPLTSSDGGSTATVTIAAWNYQMGFGQVSYNSGSITGLSFETLYYVYAEDSSFAGGAVTYSATTNAQNVVAGNGRIYVGSITTIANGAPPGGGGGGGYKEP